MEMTSRMADNSPKVVGSIPDNFTFNSSTKVVTAEMPTRPTVCTQWTRPADSWKRSLAKNAPKRDFDTRYPRFPVSQAAGSKGRPPNNSIAMQS